MKIKIDNEAISEKEMLQKLRNHFPDYRFKSNGAKSIHCKKSTLFGASIEIERKRIRIQGSFSNSFFVYIFSVLFILLGIILPLVFYFIYFHQKMKKVEFEIGHFLKAAYGIR